MYLNIFISKFSEIYFLNKKKLEKHLALWLGYWWTNLADSVLRYDNVLLFRIYSIDKPSCSINTIKVILIYFGKFKNNLSKK